MFSQIITKYTDYSAHNYPVN